MVQLMPLYPKTPSSLASFKSRLVLPFWYQLTQAHLEKRLLNGCSVVVVTKAVPIVDLMLLLLNCPINNFFFVKALLGTQNNDCNVSDNYLIHS